MRIPLPIATERLTIRPFRPGADSKAMLAVYGDPEVMRFIAGGALSDLGAVKSLLTDYAEAQRVRGFSSWAVVERTSGRVIGDAGFGVFEPTGDVELGYTLARDAWGHGYATEAAAACLASGLEHLDAPRIIAVVDEANAASLRVAERLGLTKVDTIEAHGRLHALFATERRRTG